MTEATGSITAMDTCDHMDVLRSQGVWFPGDTLAYELASPDPAELQEAFATSVMPGHTIVGLEGSLSALVEPNQPPKGYAFIDINDTVADLWGAMHMLEHAVIPPPQERANNHDYGEDMVTFTNANTEHKAQLYPLIRGSETGILPVDGIEDIQRVVASWRAEGIYVAFVSSQTAGSELHTVRNFIGRYFAGNCDGLVIPDGHYLVADKGAGARRVMERWGYNEHTPVLGIDDIPSHTAKLRATLQALEPQPNVITIQPELNSHMGADDDSIHAENSRHAFDLGTEFFAYHLGKTVLNTDDFALKL